MVGLLDEFNLEELKNQLEIEEKNLAEINKQITKLRRNHKVV